MTRIIVPPFCDMPEVRPLLTPELIQKRSDAVDAETSRELMKTAKAFVTVLVKVPRSDET